MCELMQTVNGRVVRVMKVRAHLKAGVVAIAAAGIAAVGFAAPASAQPQAQGALLRGEVAALASTCYGSARSYTSDLYDNGWFWYGSVYPSTTSNCSDINVKPTNGRIQVRTCFLPTSGSGYCNSWRTIENNTWGTAATDVRDGTKFYLNFSGPSAGLVAY